MAIKRDSLRAERDFYSPMTGNTGTEIRYAAAPTRQKDTYGSQVKSRLSEIGKGTRRSAPIIKAIKTAMKKTDDPFTQIAEKKSYAPEEENDIGAQIQGLAGQAQDAIGEGVAQVEEFARSTSKRASERRAKSAAQRKSDQASLNKRFSSVETGLSNLGKDYKAQEQRAIDNMAKFRAEQSDKFSNVDKRFGAQLQRDIQQDIATRKTAQDAKTYEQNRLKEGEKFKNRLSGVEQKQTNFSTKLQENERGQYAFRKKVGERIGGVEKGVSNLGKDYKAAEQRAVAASEAYKSMTSKSAVSKAKAAGDQANVGTGKDGTFGTGTYGKGRPSDPPKKMYGQGGNPLGSTAPRQVNKGQTTGVKDGVKVTSKPKVAVNASSFQQKNVRGSGIPGKSGKDESARPKNTPAKAVSVAKKVKSKSEQRGTGFASKPSTPKAAPKATVSKPSRTRPSRGSGVKKRSQAKAKANAQKKKTAKKKSTSRAGSKSSARGARGGTSSRSRGGTGSKGGSKGGSKSSSRGARGGSSSRSRGGTSSRRRSNRGRRGRRGGRRCDIRCKVNISLLTNMNLLRDDLADVAYFVRELKEV